MDHLTPEKRSWNMSRIKFKDTTPELIVRSFLHRNGFRFFYRHDKNNSGFFKQKRLLHTLFRVCSSL